MVEISGSASRTIHFTSALSVREEQFSGITYHRITSDKPVAVLNTALGSSSLNPYLITLTDFDRWSTTLTFAMLDPDELESLGVPWSSLIFNLTVITDVASRNRITINERRANITWGPVVSVFLFFSFVRWKFQSLPCEQPRLPSG